MAEETTYNVGICQLVQHTALDQATLGFKDALTDAFGEAVTFDEQNAAGDSATCATIVNQFVSNGVDLILANATASLQAAQAATNEIPVLGTAVTDYGTALDMDDWTGTTGTNISGTSDLAPLDEQAAMIQELFPEASNVGILYCSAEANSVYQAGYHHPAYLEEMGYTVNVYTFADSNDVGICHHQPPARRTMCFTSPRTIRLLPVRRTSTMWPVLPETPIIAGEEGICAGCGVATLSIDYYELGYTTGEMAVRILKDGEDVSTMEVEFAPNVTKKYNAEICESLGIEIPDDYVAIEAAE